MQGLEERAVREHKSRWPSQGLFRRILFSDLYVNCFTAVSTACQGKTEAEEIFSDHWGLIYQTFFKSDIILFLEDSVSQKCLRWQVRN